MSVKNIVRYILDILLLIGLVVLFDKRALGMNLHEIIGLVIGGGVLVHIIINFKWVINITKLIFSKKINSRVKFGYILNFMLLVCMILIIISGVFISKTILTDISSQNHIWKSIHVSVSNITLIFVGIHVGLHWNWVSNMTNKIFKIKIPIIITILILCFGCYSIYSEKFIVNTLKVFNSQSLEHNKRGDRPNSMSEMPDMNDNRHSDNKPDINKDNIKENFNKNNIKNDKNMSNKSIINVVINYLSICSVFIILTYYIDNYIKSKNKNNMQGGENEEV